ncbi:UDP-3-O-[3-hydroxymyristoyl] N-acetylglucosamine deacetylase [candidate division KSB1 bacterium]|nr:MAG: UDP-3-O-[3-hydroxymyristoyl] N-acetylglucosamine deacetylase [candidate division KSB1 bacterium]
MITTQRTIKRSVEYSGIGLHTGNKTILHFKPAPPDTWIKFVRTDLDGKPEIPALIDNVVDISRGTTLGKNGVQVHTVEHVLAAVAGLQIDNLIIEINTNEPPVGDGSALPFVNVLNEAGFEDQKVPRNFLVVDETVSYKDEENEVEIVALPLNDFRITVMIDYKIPALGSQHTGLFSLEEEFIKDFAPARTFCFLNEVEMLHEQGLIKGGNLDNAIVIVDRKLTPADINRIKRKLNIDEKVSFGKNGILNGKELRFKNEPCRHKLLDLLGDLTLVGIPLKAQILAARIGHKSNIEFVKNLRKLYEKKQLTVKYQTVSRDGIVFDINAISKIMPHKYPFLLVDKILELDMEKRIVGCKNVTYNEPFFQGHFPGHPIMPGVLIVEAMAQVGGILLLNTMDNPEDKLVYFMGLDKVRFIKPVYPGDQLIFELNLLRKIRNTFTMKGKAFVDNKVVCEAVMMAAIVNK